MTWITFWTAFLVFGLGVFAVVVVVVGVGGFRDLKLLFRGLADKDE